MATCDDVRPLLGAFADKALSPLEAEAVAAHIEQCGRCRQTVRDQQRVQHVLDSFQPPPVPEHRWEQVGKRLRAELEGRGERTVLKTRPRIETLEPTPVSTPSLRPEEMATPFARGPEPPRSLPRAPSTTVRPPSVTVLRVHAARGREAFGWVAHVVGAVAASIIIALGILSVTPPPAGPAAPPAMATVGPIALAGPQDVSILEVEMTDPGYNLVVAAGDANEVAAVLVVPSRGDG
ncbi:MAG: zf-HC2 domain-containing protein [Planctomycetes bacterium]|nr:zf-HC2 domain-containing protein [Planctomycetota bacterium]